ncbi:ABC transporter permease [Rhodococcus sp. Q]|uniref:ABC transporter permease n=1 Tax=Rhodococcus sp. Q TaxID=2502252 RepID=UPI0010F82593|nr:ABC transporter permease [Rhodococcus sp. Q]
MIWATWRQHRATILVALGSVALLTVTAFLAGLVVRRSDSPAPYGTFFGCVPGGGSAQCWAESTLTLVTLVTVLLPVLLGLLVGVTVFSRDIERGTHVLGLSQSVSRARWYWTRVLVVFVPVTVAVVLFGCVLDWTRSTVAGPRHAYIAGGSYSFYSPLSFPLFQSTGMVAGAYTLLALILGSGVALLLRNTIGAMVVTLIAMSVLLVGFQFGARPHYTAATVHAQPLGWSSGAAAYSDGQLLRSYDAADDPRSWQLDSNYVDTDGNAVPIDYNRCETVYEEDWQQQPDETFAEYETRRNSLETQQEARYTACLRAQGADHFEIRYHPVSLLRRFQVTEAALALALSALLFVPSLWALRRLRP